MSAEDEALETLDGEYDSAIADIRANPGTDGCRSHGPMARGMIVLLRGQKASNRSRQREIEEAASKKFYLWKISVVSGLLGAALGNMPRVMEFLSKVGG
jgi:hypothetical protein